MTLATSEEWLHRPGTVGRAARQQQILIIGEDGEEVDPGTDGTIYVSTADGVSFSYLNDEAKTAAAHRGNAFTVGDVGRVDNDGYLFITGRKSDVIVSSGVNIYPVEIESALSDIQGMPTPPRRGLPDTSAHGFSSTPRTSPAIRPASSFELPCATRSGVVTSPILTARRRFLRAGIPTHHSRRTPKRRLHLSAKGRISDRNPRWKVNRCDGRRPRHRSGRRPAVRHRRRKCGCG
jgi:acyl-CoA synthetase (AMP-forming)/AMP-acid ligase II